MSILDSIISIEEMASRSIQLSKLSSYTAGIIQHCAKLYIVEEQSNWLRTIKREMYSIEKNKSSKFRLTSNQYYEYVYVKALRSREDSKNGIIATSLRYKDNVPTKSQYKDFKTRVEVLFEWFTLNLFDDGWKVYSNAEQIDNKLIKLFMDKV